MPFLMLKHVPRYECLLEAAKEFPDLDPSACEAYLHVLRAGDLSFQVAAQFFAKHQISQGRFFVLMHLLDSTKSCLVARTPAELADLAGVTRATMTGLVDTLERDGLVTRAPDPEDRRMLSVRLTAKGEEMVANILPEHFRRTSALMTTLSEEERKTLVRLLEKVQEQAAKALTPTPPAAESSQLSPSPAVR